MESRVKLLGHPVHQMLVPIPAGLFIVGAVLDIIGAFVESSWIPTVSYWNIAIGLVAAAVAAVFGIADWTKIPSGTRAKRVATVHWIGNAAAIVLFALSIWIRSMQPGHVVTGAALAMQVIAFALLGVAAWFGGELVDRLGVGVDDGAHVDAPNSLRERHVTSTRH